MLAMDYQSPDPYIEKKGSFYQCNLCASYMNGMAQVQSHVFGANHQSRLKTVKPALHQAEANIHFTQQKLSSVNLCAESNLPQYVEKHGFGYKCACCDIPLNSNQQIMSHVAGAKHIKKATSFYQKETKMEIENMSPLVNDHRSVAINPSTSNTVSNSNLPPYVERFGDQYKCGCCNTMLNSSAQIQSHVSGTKHIKAKLFYDANPALSLAKSNCESLKGAENSEELFDFYSNLEEINQEELMKNLKIITANEDVIF